MIDTKKEHIAVTEARKLGLPVVAVVDTNCDPDVIDYVIPGNDDAIRSGSLMCRVLADAVVEGRFIAEFRRKNAPPPAEEVNSGPSPRTAPPAAPSAPTRGGAGGRAPEAAPRAPPAAGRAGRRRAAPRPPHRARRPPAERPAPTPSVEAELAEVATGAAAEA